MHATDEADSQAHSNAARSLTRSYPLYLIGLCRCRSLSASDCKAKVMPLLRLYLDRPTPFREIAILKKLLRVRLTRFMSETKVWNRNEA